MGFIVVQWENKNSVRVLNVKKIIGTVELKDGTAVDISTGVAIYTAMILKVCGK